MRISDKVFVVTGAGNGMGREVTLLLLKLGASGVAAVDISENGLEETANQAGELANKLSTHVVDITDRAAVETLPDAVIEAHERVDGLINNAGVIQPFVRFSELDYPDIERVMKVNFWGMIYMTKTFLPLLSQRPEGHIVNMSSMGGFLPVPGQTIYGASKAAVKLFTEGLYAELLPTNIHVTVVFPGAIATNIAENSGIDMAMEASSDGQNIRMTSPDTAAEIILTGIEQNAYQVFVGQDSRTMNLFYRLAPQRAVKMIYNQMKSLLANISTN